jgi:hypothetical protein
VAFQIVEAINRVYECDRIRGLDGAHELMQFLYAAPTSFMFTLVTRLHSLITYEVVTESLRLDFMEQCVKCLDILYRIN